MAERRAYSEEMEAMKEDFLEGEEEEEMDSEEMEKLAKDYLKKTYGVDEMPVQQ